jgi:hypothetical protein
MLQPVTNGRFLPTDAVRLGHLQSPDSLSLGRLLPDAVRPFIVGFSEITILNVCSHREQSFRRQNQHDGEGREAVESRCGAVALGSMLSVAVPFV